MKNKNKVAGMAFCVFILFIAMEIDSKLTLHNMEKVLLFNLEKDLLFNLPS